MPPELVIITPARDEEATLERTIESMVAQTVRPDLWILVDDGSSDRTPEIMCAAAEANSWIRIVHCANRGHRQVGGGVIDAFYAGFAAVDIDYEFIAKADADIVFQPTYIETLLGRFSADAKLGAASGKLYRLEDGRQIEEFMIDGMVAGAFQFYRREVFEEIGGFVSQVMWDGIAFHRTRMAGYETRSYPDEEFRILELRPMGASEGNVYRGRMRWGYGQWFMGSAFPYLLASGFFRMREKPRILGGLLIILGYLQAAVTVAGRYEDAEFRRELRRWQYERIRKVLSGGALR